ncbi:hypothetical protein NDN08_000465 [Rhodosorus marinus]|uniref:Uncharacterized protein n=1 Tax=Rhodosorus marinus TaxID=101924 RepID=A0AAV8UN10_9RHOD|nr:hypothetical protein NDN08_000465 [Rhodosorus marinus]
MGVPRFYRWISERYPLIRRDVGFGEGTPTVDNLYLDLNGVIHTASRADEVDKPVLSEEDIFLNSFKKIDELIEIIQPTELIYFAVDGVAPRAKMNQQRSRRFRSAKERVEEAQKSAETELIPSDNYFDSNCITPGTKFMLRLTEALTFYAEKKLTEDVRWENLQVIVSGPNTPGEGEHKIMEYIREMKAKGELGSNKRHCLYGLDADLIMLALVTHEPHFILLREKVNMGPGSFGKSIMPKPPKATQSGAGSALDYELLSIGVLRECLDSEFSGLKLSFYDLERIVDDLVVLFFIVGNDFIPHLPALDIGEGGLDMMLRMYKHLLPGQGGYINDSGTINLNRLERVLRELAKIEGDTLVRRREMAKQKGRGAKRITIDDLWTDDIPEFKSSNQRRTAPTAVDSRRQDLKRVADAGNSENEDSDASDLLSDEALIDLVNIAAPENPLDVHLSLRKAYYEAKCGFSPDNMELLSTRVEDYVKVVLWTVKYYYCGVVSWRWFYPYHFSPMLVDMINLSRYSEKITFELGEPFLPAQQLMAVLPPSSSWALPQPYRKLMLSEESPIAEYYPVDFKVDLNQKKNAWEGVVLLPFVDERELISAMDTVNPEELSEEERRRNTPAKSILLKKATSPNRPSEDRRMVKSPIPNVMKDFPAASDLEEVEPDLNVEPFRGRKPDGVLEPVNDNETLGGWPTLASVPFYSAIRPIMVNLFGYPSKYASFVVTPGNRIDEDHEPTPFLPFQSVDHAMSLGLKPGNKVLVDYPFQAEARVEGIMDSTTVVRFGENGSLVRERVTGDRFLDLKMKMIERQTTEKALRMVDSTVLCDVRLPKTKNPVTGDVQEYRAESKIVAGELLIPWYKRSSKREVSQDYVPGQKVLCTEKLNFHGRVGTIQKLTNVGEDEGEHVAVVDFLIPVAASTEIEYSHKIFEADKKATWFSPGDLGSSLKIFPPLVSRIMGSLLVSIAEPKKKVIDVGLGVKSPRIRCYKPGYARRVAPKRMSQAVTGVIYEYSEETYKKEFPEVLKVLEDFMKKNDSQDSKDTPVLELIPPGGNENGKASVDLAVVSRLVKWLDSLGLKQQPLLPVESQAASKATIAKIEQFTKRMLRRQKDLVTTIREDGSDFYLAAGANEAVVVKLKNLENGRPSTRGKAPTFVLMGDRVVNRSSETAVPFGARGTVVGIFNNAKDAYVEVVYDEPFVGGTSLNSRCTEMCGKLEKLSNLLVLTPMKWSKQDDLSKDEDVKPAEQLPARGGDAEESGFRPLPPKPLPPKPLPPSEESAAEILAVSKSRAATPSKSKARAMDKKGGTSRRPMVEPRSANPSNRSDTALVEDFIKNVTVVDQMILAYSPPASSGDESAPNSTRKERRAAQARRNKKKAPSRENSVDLSLDVSRKQKNRTKSSKNDSDIVDFWEDLQSGRKKPGVKAGVSESSSKDDSKKTRKSRDPKKKQESPVQAG